MKRRRWLSICLLLLAIHWLTTPAFAGPYIAPGDLALRHDIQLLADYGVIAGTVTNWPLSWGAIISDIEHYDDAAALPDDVEDALARIRARARRVTRLDEVQFSSRLAIAERPTAIRSFQDTPREDAEFGIGVSWTGKRFSINLAATVVDSPKDAKEYRADGSAIGMALGNFTLAASAMDRWWGPGWDGSLIL
ncbi:MAG: capsule assembly Wzi family protein, partial [Woeseia sp.]